MSRALLLLSTVFLITKAAKDEWVTCDGNFIKFCTGCEQAGTATQCATGKCSYGRVGSPDGGAKCITCREAVENAANSKCIYAKNGNYRNTACVGSYAPNLSDQYSCYDCKNDIFSCRAQSSCGSCVSCYNKRAPAVDKKSCSLCDPPNQIIPDCVFRSSCTKCEACTNLSAPTADGS